MNKNLVLDFDGTLVELSIDWKTVKNEMNSILKRHGIAARFGPILETLSSVKATNQDVANELEGILNNAEIKGLDRGRILEGAFDVIRFAVSRGYSVWIWSRNGKRVIEKFLLIGGIRVDRVLSREYFSYEKDLPTCHNTCVLVTDHIKDVEIGKKKGYYVVGRGNKRFGFTDLVAHGADIVITSLLDLEGLL